VLSRYPLDQCANVLTRRTHDGKGGWVLGEGRGRGRGRWDLGNEGKLAKAWGIYPSCSHIFPSWDRYRTLMISNDLAVDATAYVLNIGVIPVLHHKKRI